MNFDAMKLDASINLDASLAISPDVLTQMVGDELVLLDLSGEAYFGLDPVGARIWQLLEQGTRLNSIIALLLTEYDVTEQVLRSDLEKLVADLIEHKLATLEP